MSTSFAELLAWLNRNYSRLRCDTGTEQQREATDEAFYGLCEAASKELYTYARAEAEKRHPKYERDWGDEA